MMINLGKLIPKNWRVAPLIWIQNALKKRFKWSTVATDAVTPNVVGATPIHIRPGIVEKPGHGSDPFIIR